MTADNRESLAEHMAAAGRAHTHCCYCGRQLEDICEPGQLYDQQSGERIPEVWRQCPRFARSWRNLWMGACHESFVRDNPMHCREWR